MNQRAKFIRKVFRLVQSVDSRWTPNQPSFRAAMILVAACFIGTDEKRIADGLGMPETFVRRVAARCRKQRIWRADRIRTAWEQSDVAFICDALVASGQVDRPPEEKVTARNKAVRAKRMAAGACTNCGKGRDSDNKVCSACAESMKASRARRQQPSAQPPVMASCDPLYQIASVPSAQDRDSDL